MLSSTPGLCSVGSGVTAACTYLTVLRERKQEMLAIAELLCTLWEIMGTVQRGRDVPQVMFHISTASTLSGQEAAFPAPPQPLCAPALVILLTQSGDSMLVCLGCKFTSTA